MAMDTDADTSVLSHDVEKRGIDMRFVLTGLYIFALSGCAAIPQPDWLQGNWKSDSDSTIQMNVKRGVFPANTELDDPVSKGFQSGKITIEGRIITETDLATKSGTYKVIEEEPDSTTLAINWPPKATYRFVKMTNGFCMSLIPTAKDVQRGMPEEAWSCFSRTEKDGSA